MPTKSIFIMLLLFYNMILFPIITKSRIWSSYYFNRFDSSSLKPVLSCSYFIRFWRVSFAFCITQCYAGFNLRHDSFNPQQRCCVFTTVWEKHVLCRTNHIYSFCHLLSHFYHVIQGIQRKTYLLISDETRASIYIFYVKLFKFPKMRHCKLHTIPKKY